MQNGMSAVSGEALVRLPGAELCLMYVGGSVPVGGEDTGWVRTVFISHWLLRLYYLFVFRHCKETYLMLFNLYLPFGEVLSVWKGRHV